jgi:uncharacterized protein YkwD
MVEFSTPEPVKFKEWIIFFAMIALIIVLSTMTSKAQGTTFYSKINELRAEKNLPPLQSDTSLEKSSLRWLKKISDQPMRHDYTPGFMEVLVNTEDVNIAIDAFMNSKAHASTLMTEKATRIGVAFYNGRLCARLN